MEGKIRFESSRHDPKRAKESLGNAQLFWGLAQENRQKRKGSQALKALEQARLALSEIEEAEKWGLKNDETESLKDEIESFLAVLKKE